MKRPLTIMDRRFPSGALVDQQGVDMEANERDLLSKVDRRNVLAHTFTSTDLEIINHKLRRVPIGVSVIYQSASASISGDKSQWTDKRIYMRSSVADVTVTLQLQ